VIAIARSIPRFRHRPSDLSILEREIVLTDAQVRTANTVPISIVVAQGLRSRIVPISYAIAADVTLGFSAAPTWSLRYATVGLDISDVCVTAHDSIGFRSAFGTATANSSTAAAQNLDLQIRTTANIAGGSTSSGTRVKVFYHVIRQ
jgi:hypothetical protein